MMLRSCLDEPSVWRHFRSFALVVLVAVGLPVVGQDVKRGVVNFAPPKLIEAAPTGFSGKTLLANADFDEDGMPDLAVVRGDGYSVAVSILSGNVRSIHPNAPIDGVNVLDIPADQPFFRREGIVETNLADVTAAFVGAGDFNADGHRDIVIADNDKLVLHFLLGDGRGAFPRSQTVEIGEFIRALKVAEVNRYDGLEDIVIGVDRGWGEGSVMIFESPKGAMTAVPEIYPTNNRITDLSIGTVDNDHLYDIAVSNGNELTLIWGRDRKLTWEPEVRNAIPAAEIQTLQAKGELLSVAIANFRSDEWNDIVTLDQKGQLTLYRSDVRELLPNLIAGEYPADARIVTGRFSSAPVDCLLIRQKGESTTQIVSLEHGVDDPNVQSVESNQAAASAADTDLLAMRLSTDALEDIATVANNTVQTLLTVPAAVFVVRNTNDSGPDSLRQAIIEANGSPGSDQISFNIAGGAPQTITLMSPIPISDPVVIDGNTQPAPAGSSYRIRITKGFPQNSAGLQLVAGNSTILGIRFFGFTAPSGYDRSGLEISQNGGNIIQQNAFGDPTGNAGNYCGLLVFSSGNMIGGFRGTESNLFRANFTGLCLAATGSNSVRGNAIFENQLGPALGIDVRGSNVNLLIGGVEKLAGNHIYENRSISCLDSRTCVGIRVNGATGTSIQGNLVGPDSKQMISGQQLAGIEIIQSSNLLIGGSTALAKNTISGNVRGIWLAFDVASTSILSNYIGLDQDGNIPVPNNTGVQFGASECPGAACGVTENLLGGDFSTGLVTNFISANYFDGVKIISPESGTINRIQGNVIGLTAAFAGGSGNGNNKTGTGSGIGGTASGGTIRIGGTGSTANLISGNRNNGILLEGNTLGVSGFVIEGNFIGTDQSGGDGNIGNGENGIFLGSLALLNSINANRIAYNGLRGIAVSSQNPTNRGAPSAAQRIEITKNEIFSNGRMAPPNGALNVDLGDAGPTANDLGDVDSGGNGLQNYPLIALASRSSTNVTVSGSLNSLPSNRYRLEFFYTASCSNNVPTFISRFLGSTFVTTGSAEVFTPFSVSFPLPVDFPTAGTQIQAVAINDPGTGTQSEAQNTSEYSPCFSVTNGTPTPTATPTNTPTATPTASPTGTPSATPTVTPTPGFEGDIAPRPLGDGTITSTDVIQLRRFATGLDTPNPAFNEAQRADCAPRGSFGDGIINSADVIQARRYATGLDPIEPAGGSIPSLVNEIVNANGAYSTPDMAPIVGLGQAEETGSAVVRVPINLKRSDEIAAIAFSVEFDTSELTNLRLALGDNLVAGTTITLNRSYEADGRLGVLIDSDRYLAREGTVVYLVFDRISVGNASVKLTDYPVRRSAADPDGNDVGIHRPSGEDDPTRSFISSLFGYLTRFASSMGLI